MKQKGIIVLIVLVVLFATNALFHGVVVSWIPHGFQNALSWIPRSAGSVALMMRSVRTALQNDTMLAERDDLQRELISARAHIQSLSLEVQSLQASLALKARVPSEMIRGSIYTITSSGGVRQATLNRGTSDGVAVGDSVMTPKGELIGVVAQTQSLMSTVNLLGDMEVSVTVRLLNGDVTGLVRALSPDKLIMDLVQKDEHITQGATIVTSGDDQVPAGLVVGTVHAVDSEAASLFQSVRVTPAMRSIIQGDVLIAHRSNQ